MISKPYYAVIFTSQLSSDIEDYEKVAHEMALLAEKQHGYLGIDSVRNEAGFGITVSYWESLEAIQKWKDHAAHTMAKTRGKEQWYKQFHTKICVVEQEYGFQKKSV
ncbi:antibiotic biosynthesis monooxygenase [Bacillus manliponensis]|uniref:antibiotic biosynthesis monooxygenase family protein n=1 Tax=Bacillus manliponensis TaxID=574376 RepID=UPI0035161948